MRWWPRGEGGSGREDTASSNRHTLLPNQRMDSTSEHSIDYSFMYALLLCVHYIMLRELASLYSGPVVSFSVAVLRLSSEQSPRQPMLPVATSVQWSLRRRSLPESCMTSSSNWSPRRCSRFPARFHTCTHILYNHNCIDIPGSYTCIHNIL